MLFTVTVEVKPTTFERLQCYMLMVMQPLKTLLQCLYLLNILIFKLFSIYIKMFFTEIEIGQDLEPHYLKCDFLLLLCISFIMAKPINSLKRKKEE